MSTGKADRTGRYAPRPDVTARHHARHEQLLAWCREPILEFAAQRRVDGTRDPSVPWKVLAGRLGVRVHALERMRRELGLKLQTKKAPGEGRLGEGE